MDDDIFNSDDEDQIFNEAYNFNLQKRNKIYEVHNYDGDVEDGVDEDKEKKQALKERIAQAMSKQKKLKKEIENKDKIIELLRKQLLEDI